MFILSESFWSTNTQTTSFNFYCHHFQSWTMFQKTAYDLWKDERAAGCIVTLCKEFDDAIGGGIPIGSITEIVGGPGVGKTQFWWDDLDRYFFLFFAFTRIVNLIEFDWLFSFRHYIVCSCVRTYRYQRIYMARAVQLFTLTPIGDFPSIGSEVRNTFIFTILCISHDLLIYSTAKIYHF